MQYRKPRKGGTGYRAQTNPSYEVQYSEKQNLVQIIALDEEAQKRKHELNRGQMRREERIRKRDLGQTKVNGVKNSSCCRYLNLAGAGQPGRNATNRERLMGRKHRLEAIAQVGNDWAGRRVRSWTRSLGCRWVGRTRRWIQEAGRPSSASRRRGRGDW